MEPNPYISFDDGDANQLWERKALEILTAENGALRIGKTWAYRDDGGKKTTCSGTHREPHEEIDHNKHSTCPVCKLQVELDVATKEHHTVEAGLREDIEDLAGSVVLLEKENKELSNENFDLRDRIKEWNFPSEDIPNTGRKIRA